MTGIVLGVCAKNRHISKSAEHAETHRSSIGTVENRAIEKIQPLTCIYFYVREMSIALCYTGLV